MGLSFYRENLLSGKPRWSLAIAWHPLASFGRQAFLCNTQAMEIRT
jgi:hypothetical protein